jgi:hypothetical protein
MDLPHRATQLFSVHFCPHLCTPEKTSRSVIHPEIASGQARLTPEFFARGLLKKKVYLGGMSILSILLSLELGCHNPPPPLRRPTSSSVNAKPGMSPLGHVGTSSAGIRVLYIQLVAYIPYRVPLRGPTRHAYVSTSMTCTPPYPSQLTRTRS